MVIHNTAIIASGAKIGKNVSIGPYSVIGENVTLHDNVKLHSHVCVDGITEVGEGTEIFPFASIGHRPQDLKYSGERSEVVIGKNNVIREYVTVHPGTLHGAMKTVIGDNCLIMISSHIAHDCIIGNNVILANNASLAGHVEVADDSIIGGMSGIRQFVRIGKGAIIGGGSMVDSDVAPYASVSGERAGIIGLNLIGMKRRNISKEIIKQTSDAFKEIFYSHYDTLEERLAKVLESNKDNDMILEIAQFIRSSNGKAGLCKPKN